MGLCINFKKSFILNIMKKIFRNIDCIGKILFAVIIIFTILGEGFKFYQKFYWWDLLLHFIAGICFVSIGLGIAKCVPNLKLKHMLIFSFMFALTSHIAWELIEFICDIIFDLNMQRWRFDSTMPDTYGKIISVRTPGVIDTMTDFIANISGALLMCIGYVFASKYSKKDIKLPRQRKN